MGSLNNIGTLNLANLDFLTRNEESQSPLSPSRFLNEHSWGIDNQH